MSDAALSTTINNSANSATPKTFRHALLMFSKPPVPGLVKTRLTHAHGGIFSEEEAAQLFHRSLFDVMELCINAIAQLEAEDAANAASAANSENSTSAANAAYSENDADTENAANEQSSAGAQAATANLTDSQAAVSNVQHEYAIFISTTPEENVQKMREVFEEAGEWPREFNYIVDKGENFDIHFDDAFNQIFALGYDSILSVGGDIPMLPFTHVTSAFRWLQYFLETSEVGGLVQAPCQECGVSVIGWTRNTKMDHQGVYYNMTGRPALDAYVEKCEEAGVPMASLTPVADVDDMQDLAHAISLARSAEYTSKFQSDFYVPERFLSWVNWRGIKVGTPPNEDRDSREGIDN
ncbi:MAG: DUF2064 domain-containing protein [Coriobacteriales bacterium]|jgi:glycosyltransferase A (GT-A) superfamily protein (DUF2064 family)|nr:DUF2064 domain-containing protein [Coriobacteriales bacterium]